MHPHIVCVGGEDHALRIPFLIALRRRGYRVTAISTGNGVAFAKADISHHSYSLDRFSCGPRDWKTIGLLRRIIASSNPDIVHSFDTKPNLLVPFAMRGGPAVVRTINGLGWVFSSTEPRALALRVVFCALQGLTSHWTAATVFQNCEDLAFFNRYRLLGPSQSKLIGSSGIDSENFFAAQRSGPPPEQLRAKLGKLNNSEIVMFVGRLTRQKGIPTLLKAVPLVLAQRPCARFILVGPLQSEGPFAVDSASIERLAPHVISVGHRTDVPSLLRIANVFAFPTEYREGVPRVLLEAGLASLPIVASSMPGCSDVVEHGYNGYLVKPRDPSALAMQIVHLLRDPQRARIMGSRSIPLVRQRFELARIVQEYCDLYDTILSKNYDRKPDEALRSPTMDHRKTPQELRSV